MNPKQRWTELVKKQGPRPVLCWWLELGTGIIQRRFRIPLHYYDVHYYRQRIPQEIPSIQPKVSIRVEELTMNTVKEMETWLPESKADLFRKRLSTGKEGLVCRSDDQIVYHTWYTDRDEYDASTNMWVRLEPEEGYIFDSFCRREFRGKSIHSYMHTLRLNRLKDKGCKFAVGVVHTTNFSSRFSLFRSGYRADRRVVSLGIGNRLLRFRLKPSLLRWELAMTQSLGAQTGG